MDKDMEALFERARAFEEGEFYKSEKYAAIFAVWKKHLDRLNKLTNGELDKELLELFGAIGDEWTLQCEHFFMEGYRLGKEDGMRGISEPGTITE